MKTKLRIAVGLPSTGNIRIETAMALISLVDETKKHFNDNIEFVFIYLIGSYIHENRTVIALNAQKENATHLLFVDTDMVPPADGLIRLLERDKMIIGADYNLRRMPIKSIAKYNIKNYKKDEPFEAEFIPAGFMLINMKVFDKLKRPWFFYKTGNKAVDSLGEDFWFCKVAREAGFKIYIEPELKVWHIGNAVF